MDICTSPLTSTTHPCSLYPIAVRPAQLLLGTEGDSAALPSCGDRGQLLWGSGMVPVLLVQTQLCCIPSPCPCQHRGSAQQLLSISSVFSSVWSFQHQQGNVMFHLPPVSCSSLFLEECHCFPGMRLPCALPLLAALSLAPLSSPGVELQLHFVLELVWASPAPLLPPLSAPAQREQAALAGSDLSPR